MEPRICERMTCIWIGGADYPEGGEEFNLMSDINAANVVLSSSMPLWQVPTGTYKQFAVSLAELQLRVRPCGKIGRYLFGQMVTLNDSLAALPEWPHGETWCLGDVGVIFTMNAPQSFYQLQYKRKLTEQANAFRSLNGKVQTLCSFDTLQVKDYSKFNMADFDAEHKKAHHEKQFPLDLEKARQMDAELVRLKAD